MGLTAYKQIRFLPILATTGTFTLIINRAGFPGLTQAATDTLLLDDSGDQYYPFMIAGDFELSKKFTTTTGRRALDDLPIQIRDGLGYSGTVNGGAVSEDFTSIFQTFFDIWFTGSAPYRAFLLYTDAATGNSEVSHAGWIDPTYNPSSDAYVINPGTSSQIWLGTRTIKVTAMSQAQQSIVWRNILQPYDATLNPNVPNTYTGIAASDCQEGNPYNGFMFAPPNCQQMLNTRANATDGTTGNWYQACPHIHNSTENPVLVPLPSAVWPVTPWISDSHTGTIANSIEAGTGVGYAPGDTGTINGGSILAIYRITAVTAFGLVESYVITSTGGGYSTGTAGTTNVIGTGSGFGINILRVVNGAGWGPSGNVFISVGTLFAKIAAAMGLSTFTPSTDLKSALSFWAQKANTASGQACFPIDNSAAIPLDQIYISLNVFAQSHSYDGSLWNNPVGFAPETAIADVITGLCNFLLSDFNESVDSSGNSTLQLKAMGGVAVESIVGQIIGVPVIEEPSTMPTNARVSNTNDSLVIQCPVSDVGTSSQISIPIRLHRIGVTSGSQIFGDIESTTWDGSDITTQADACFKVAWIDGDGNPTINPDCWKGLCYAYWFNASNANVVYPSNWSPFDPSGSWANSFYVVNACYKSGSTPSANLQNEIQGNDYFNSRDYHAVAFAALTLLKQTVQSFEYSGITNNAGSIQAITSGMGGTWRLASNPSQSWRAIEVRQTLLVGTTAIKWQALGTLPSGQNFPAITDLTYGPVTGAGTSSSTGGNTLSNGDPSGGGTTLSNALLQNPATVAVNTITPPSDIVGLTHKGIAGQTSDFRQVLNSSGTLLLKETKDGKSFAQGFDAGSQTITNVADPFADTDAANKDYVDDAVATVNPLTTLGDIIYEDGTPTPVRLPGNTTGVLKVLTQTGTGTISAAPAWTTASVALGSLLYSNACGGGSTGLASVLNFYNPNGQTPGQAAIDPSVEIVISYTQTWLYFYGELDIAPGIGQSVTFKVYINGTPGALTFTISGTNKTGNDSAGGHAIGFAQGDRVTISVIKTAGAASTLAAWGVTRLPN